MSKLITQSLRTLAWPRLSIHSGSSGGSSVAAAIFSARPAHAVERGAVVLGDERLVVVGDQQLFHRGPERLELLRAAEIGLADQVPGEREDAPLAIFVGRDGVEDGRQAIGRMAVEREGRRQQLRHLRIVERSRRCR